MNNHPLISASPNNPMPDKPKGNLRLKVVLLGLGILACGVVIGAGGMLFWGRELILKRLQHVRPKPEMICDRLETTLSLTAVQKAEVARVINEYFPRIRAIRQDKDQLTHEQFQAMHRDIFAVLDSRQAKLYEEELAKMLPRPWRRRGFHRSVPPPAIPLENKSAENGPCKK